MISVHQRFQICLCRLKIPRIILGVDNGHEPSVDVLDLIPSLTVALTGGGFCFLGLFSRRVIGFLPQRYTLFQFGHALAVGILCGPVLRRLAAEQRLHLCDKGFQGVQQLLGGAAVLLGEVLK